MEHDMETRGNAARIGIDGKIRPRTPFIMNIPAIVPLHDRVKIHS